MKKTQFLPVILSVALLAACKPDAAPQAATEAAGATATPTPAAVVTRVASDNGMLTVDPAVIDLCKEPEGVVEADVSWDATAAGTEGVQVWLQGPDGAKQLWSESGAVSTARTGRWLSNGSEVVLVNGTNAAELARIKVKSQPCNGG